VDPRDEYTTRLAARQEVVERYERLHIRLGNVRLAVAAAALLTAWFGLFTEQISGYWLFLPVSAFVTLLVVHDRVLKRKRRAERSAEFYQRGLDRLDDQWAGKGEAGSLYLDDRHPYARDLDLFGSGSLFELLSSARTLGGEWALAKWLTTPAPPEEVIHRQAAVKELRNRLDLREDMAVLGDEVRRAVHAKALPRWGERPPLLDSTLVRIVAAILAAVSFPVGMWVIVVGLQWLSVGGPAHPTLVTLSRIFLVLAGLEAVLALIYRRRVRESVAEAELPGHDLALLADIMTRLEREQFESPRLVALRKALETDGHPASHEINRLRRWMDMLDSSDHLIVRAIGPLLLWTTQVAFGIEAWRKSTGPSVRRWLDAVSEFEALSSLAGYAYERPEDPFPEFVAGGVFDGQELGHPLLPKSRCVRNDVHLGGANRVWIVSGSNMSGKSTLLRTVGVNAVLAMAGAPVRARSLRVGQISLGASIRVTDSLREGTSRFYAEIKRIRQLVDIAGGERPLLFLLDELLHGTNSHDRRIGADAIIRGMSQRNAIGLVTTHDLALSYIADDQSAGMRNVHFEDHLVDGKMLFDYVLRPGVVRKSNALELMRSVGLDV